MSVRFHPSLRILANPGRLTTPRPATTIRPAFVFCLFPIERVLAMMLRVQMAAGSLRVGSFFSGRAVRVAAAARRAIDGPRLRRRREHDQDRPGGLRRAGHGAAAQALSNRGPHQARGHGRFFPAKMPGSIRQPRQHSPSRSTPAGAAVHRAGRLPQGHRCAPPATWCCWPRRRVPAAPPGICGPESRATCSWKSRSPWMPPAYAASSGRAGSRPRRTSRSPAA